MGQRSTEKVSAGKRAAKYIACEVCQERILALFPENGDMESTSNFLESDGLTESLGDSKTLCGMKVLAQHFTKHSINIDLHEDGTASLNKTSDKWPFYEEINQSDYVFHWLSFALQHACTETFRKDGDSILNALRKLYKK